MAPDTHAPPSHAAMQGAAEWFALLRSGDATDHDRAGWQAWLAQAQEHRAAWAYAEAIGRRFEPVQAGDTRHAASATLQQVRDGRAVRAGRRHLLRGVAVLAGTGLLGWAGWRHGALPEQALAWTADHHTATGEVRDITLEDGTRIWLNTASAIDTDYRPGLRRVQLIAGEILIETGHDRHDPRPFVADTRHGRLRALGTRFTVCLDGATTVLSVYQGAVEIRTLRGDAVRVIGAGQQARFDDQSIAETATADPAREAWRRGVLLADDIALQDLVTELNRYHRGHLGVAPAVAQLRVFGSFPLHDRQRTLAMLAQALPVRIERTLPWWTSIVAAPAKK